MKDKVVTDDILYKESFFWTPDYLDNSAWIEHIPFAFWITEVLKPKIVVELGVHTGTSYFSFCQAVKRLNIDTVCYGVDTWKGDEHAGFYEEEVFDKVKEYNRREYARFSTLVRAAFDEAKDYFIDGSIELLHIDGLHTYEAVKHDFETWLPKLKTAAIVLFHDINVRDRNFGVFRLWEELKQQYKHFQFDFGYGLGILAIGEVNSAELRTLFNAKAVDEYHIFLRNLFSERGGFFRNQFDAALLIKQGNENFAQQEKTLSHLESNNAQLIEQSKALSESNEKLKETYQTSVTELSAKLRAANAALSRVTKELSDQKGTIEALKSSVQKQSQIICWYKDTYEDRNIAGVIKEKIKSGLKKKIKPRISILNGRIKKNTYHLHPANDIETLSDPHTFASVGTDPFFIADMDNKVLGAGWYWLAINIIEVEGLLLSPTLYYDYGRGFNQEDIWKLPNVCNGKIEGLVNFPSSISGLRFDPTTTQCTFRISEFHLKPVGKTRAFQIAVSKYKRIYWPHRNQLSFYAGLLFTWLKTGNTELRKKIRNSVVYTNHEISLEKYQEWCALFDTVSSGQLEIIRTISVNLECQPVFSIIMPVYNAPVKFLKMAIESVRNQAYKNWELCIADDKSTSRNVKNVLKAYQAKDQRIKVIYRNTNGHISNASNSALSMAVGDFIVLLDQDDELPPHCLYMVARAINENKNLELIYSDEDKIDEQGNRFDPYFKSDWNKDLFYGQNMISHLGVYKLSLVKKVGGFRVGYEGSQDYDLALRCIEHLEPHQIYHIPHVLYHWRAIGGSTSVDTSNKSYAFDAGLRALNDHLKRTRQTATAEQNVFNSYRVKWKLPAQEPMVSIIIPTKDKVDVLSACVSSIIQKTCYKNFELLIIDNSSEEPSAIEYLKKIQKEHKQVKVYTYDAEFNFSAIVNYGVQKSKGEIILLLNNDTEVINEDWLCEMASQCMRKEIGAVGAKLFYPNGQIQHAGVILFEGHPGNHIYLNRDKTDPGYLNKLNLVQNYSAVTAACLAVRKQLFLDIGGFDEKNLKIAYNDVDFCLKLRELGYENLYTPFAKLVHHESLSRGDDLDEANVHRFKKEHSYMLVKWKDAISRDPFYNPNLGQETLRTEFAFPPHVRFEWNKEIISVQKE